MTRLLIWVQNLLGSGHLKRQLLIAKQASRAGIRVIVLNGSQPSGQSWDDAIEECPLPSLRAADSSFSRLLDGNGQPVTDAYWSRRQLVLREATEKFCPDVIMTEMFPFGRRKFREEILSWFDSLNPRPKIVCSLRDILVSPKKQKRLQDSVDILNNYYDKIYVHSDPAIQPLHDTFPLTSTIKEKIKYTGYVVERAGHQGRSKTWGLAVSAGSGVVGRRLIDAVLACSTQAISGDKPCMIVTGTAVSDDDFSRWQAFAGPKLTIEKFRSDLPRIIANSQVSISQAGYNTVAETIDATTPMVLVPFETETEDEQLKRALRFEALGRAVVVRERHLSADSLRTAIARAKTLRLEPLSINLDGAAQTVSEIQTIAGAKTP